MLTTEHLSQAENLGIITAEQKGRLEALAAGSFPLTKQAAADPVGDEESFRLVGGGNDVFVGIGIVLLLSGVWSGISTINFAASWTNTILMAAFVWCVAEFITRKKRMKFSSLILATAFSICAGSAIVLLLMQNFDFSLPDNPISWIGKRDEYRIVGWLGFGGLALSALIYFFRFKVPVMAAVLTVSFVGMFGLLIADVLFGQVLSYDIQIGEPGEAQRVLHKLLYVPLICGLIIFAVGVWFDIRDRKRETLWSDCAFWLHVISAPLIVHPLFVLATGQNVALDGQEASTSATLILLVLVFVFFYVALAIDRRSLLVPSLGYFASVGLYFLVNSTSQSTGIPSFALVLVLIGILIIVFGSGWQRIRSLVVGHTMPHMVLEKLPPVKL